MVYLFLADNFELVEALATVDILRRAKVGVQTVSITDCYEVKSSSNVIVKADKLYEDCDFDNAETLILPGGPGVFGVLEFQPLCDLIIEKYNDKIMICAICAAPAVLYKLGIDVRTTVYPAMAEDVNQYVGGKVVIDGNVITGEAMGASLDFALAIVKHLKGEKVAFEIERGIAK